MAERVATVGDLWADMPGHGQSLLEPMARLRT
jgi:hypothetical protein